MKKQVNFSVSGMHCASCELLVEDELLKIPAVCSAKVYQEKGVAEVCYEGEVKDKDIEKAVEKRDILWELTKNLFSQGIKKTI